MDDGTQAEPFVEPKGLGANHQFPAIGIRLNVVDEGKQVAIVFDRPVKSMMLGRNDALNFARELKLLAKQCVVTESTK